MKIAPLLLAAIAISFACSKPAVSTEAASETETHYLLFQIFTYSDALFPPPGDIESTARDIATRIGVKGGIRNKLGVCLGPLTLSQSDDEVRALITEGFAVARRYDVAVAFHIDDQMFWSGGKILAGRDNLEWTDWEGRLNTGRRLDWGPKPSKAPPQLCLNCPGVRQAVAERARLIGSEIKKELGSLSPGGREYLFAGIIAGWETQIGREFGTDRPMGFHALSQLGFSVSHPPQDLDIERVHIVKEFMELWASSLQAAGVPREKIFCHIAITSQGLRASNVEESYAERARFALPEVAFSSAYRPGFSTYPQGGTFKEIYAALAEHGASGWISAEGANVSPAGMPGEPTMETYLGRMFNHGAVMVNIFSWGIGGEAMRNNFFRRATENPEALAAYAKFLRGDKLVESAAQGFSASELQEKLHRIQSELPGWIQKPGEQAQAMPLLRQLQSLIKDRKWQEADKVAGEILSLMSRGEKK